MKVSVVIPTIDGRESLFEQTVAAYRQLQSVELEIIAPRGFSSIGEAWVKGAAKATGQFIHLSADDVIPHAGWFSAALRAANALKYPSPRLLNVDGSLHSCGTMGGGMLLPECADGTRCNSSPFPFFRAEHTEALIGSLPPIHYYADDLLAARACSLGLVPTVCRDYCFTHLEGIVGRAEVAARAMADRQTFLNTVAGGFTCA